MQIIMHRLVSNVLGIALVVVLLVIGAATSILAMSYTDSVKDGSNRTFMVSGEGEAIAVPDIAEFSFGVISEGEEMNNLQIDNNEKANRLVGYLKENRIDKKDIKTTDYSVRPLYQHFSCPSNDGACPPPGIIGYTIEQRYSVKIRDLGTVNDVLSGIVGRGANSVSSLQFTVDDPTRLQAEARVKAIEKAKKKAESIAIAAGIKLGELISISEGGGVPDGLFYERASGLSSKQLGLGGGTAIEVGSQEIKAHVNLVYRID